MTVKLGVAPIAWSNDDMPELGAGSDGCDGPSKAGPSKAVFVGRTVTT